MVQMHSEHIHRVSISDVDLVNKVKSLAAAGEPFVIRADRSYAYLADSIRMLKSFEGLPDDRSMWRSFWDALHTSGLITCWGIAVNSNNYTWNWRETAEGIEVQFNPSRS